MTDSTNALAERSLIASLLESPTLLDEIALKLSEHDFSDTVSAEAYATLQELSAARQVSTVALTEGLVRRGVADAPAYVQEVQHALRDADPSYLIDLIAEKSAARRVAPVLASWSKTLLEGKSTTKEFVLSFPEVLAEVEDRVLSPDDFSIVADELAAEYRAIQDGTYDGQEIGTGLRCIDQHLRGGGIRPGEVMVIAAPSSCGKSVMALNIASRQTMKEGNPGAYFSFEMPARQLGERLIQMKSGVPAGRIRENAITAEQWVEVASAMEEVKRCKIYVDTKSTKVNHLVSRVRYLKRRFGIKYVTIDYLQLMEKPNIKMSRAEAVSETSRAIKRMAMEEEVACFVLSQVGREATRAIKDRIDMKGNTVEGRDLYIDDLKESGDIENDADAIVLIWPKGGDMQQVTYRDPRGAYSVLECKIGKNREGRRDVRERLRMYGDLCRMYGHLSQKDL